MTHSTTPLVIELSFSLQMLKQFALVGEFQSQNDSLAIVEISEETEHMRMSGNRKSRRLVRYEFGTVTTDTQRT